MDVLIQNLKHALRRLRRSPGYTALAVVILGLGIGGVTAGFGLLETFFLRPLPYPSADRLVQLHRTVPDQGFESRRFSLPNVLALREAMEERGDSAPVEAMGAYNYGPRNLTAPETRPERIMVSRVTVDLLRMLGVQPIRGRSFTDAEAEPGSGDVVLVDHGFWQRRFGGRPDLVGQAIRLDGTPHTVVGIMPPDVQFPFGGVKAWVPVTEDEAAFGRDYRNFMPVVRLRESVERDAAVRDLELAYRRIHERDADADRVYGVRAEALRTALLFLDDTIRPVLYAGLGASGFVLLVVCANLAGLVLARTRRRRHELAVRTALGAERGQLVVQILSETVLLALGGGLLGVLVAAWQLDLVGGFIPEDLFRVGEIGVDGSVLGVALLAVALSAAVAGLWPGLRSAREVDLRGMLGEGRRAPGGLGASRSQGALVTGQVALALVLLAGAAVVLRSFVEMRGQDPGFDPEPVLTAGWTLPEAGYPDDEARARFLRDVLAAVRAAPGVDVAGAVNPLPMNFEVYAQEFRLAGEGAGDASLRSAHYHMVAPGYFRAMGIRLLAGRTFTDRDDASAPPVVVVSRETELRYWPEEGAVGRRIRLGAESDARLATVVGVVENTARAFLGDPPGSVIYRPLLATGGGRGFLVATGTGEPAALVGPVREAVRSVDPDLPLSDVRTMPEVVQQSMAPWTAGTVALLVLGLEALVLALMGLYGVVAYAVSERTREVGIRTALGAEPAQTVALFLRRAAVQVGIGVALGLAGALVLTRAVSGLLQGVSPVDPPSLAAATAVTVLAALLAAWLPARRAARVDPMIVLREE